MIKMDNHELTELVFTAVNGTSVTKALQEIPDGDYQYYVVNVDTDKDISVKEANDNIVLEDIGITFDNNMAIFVVAKNNTWSGQYKGDIYFCAKNNNRETGSFIRDGGSVVAQYSTSYKWCIGAGTILQVFVIAGIGVSANE